MADPGNADLAFADLRKLRRHVFAGSLHEQRWDQNARQEIAFVPIGSRGTQPDAGGMPQWNRSIVVWRLANNISPVLFRKADWHGLEGYGAFTKWKALKRCKLRTRRSKERLTF